MNILIFVIFLFLFLAAIAGVFYIVIAMSGWTKLAKIYAVNSSFVAEKTLYPPLFKMNNSSFRNAIQVGIGRDGLYLASSIRILNFLQTPILIPWTNITFKGETESEWQWAGMIALDVEGIIISLPQYFESEIRPYLGTFSRYEN
jgi:hypothetical protein